MGASSGWADGDCLLLQVASDTMAAVGGNFLTSVFLLVRLTHTYRRAASQNVCRGIVPCSGGLGVTSRAQQQHHSQSLNECVKDEIILM